MAGQQTLLLLLLTTLVILECVSAMRMKKCLYNKKRYMPGAVIASQEDNCVELRCNDRGKRMNLTVTEGCTCYKEEIQTKKCKWNGKNIKVGKVAYMMPMKCFKLKCIKKDERVMLSHEQIFGCNVVAPTMPTPPTPSRPKCRYKKKFGKGHTMLLKPKETCEIYRAGVTEEEKQIILKKHNEIRTKVAKGEEEKGSPGPQPTASNMRELVWNDELAEVAQAWADQCPDGHDQHKNRRICNSTYNYVGQNIYFNWGIIDQQLWEVAIMVWYDEVKNMNEATVKQFGKIGKIIGHYTQIVWAKTHEIGCGATYYPTEIEGTKYPHAKVYVCNYGVGGNVLGTPVYEIGEAASNCADGISTNYPSLCA